MSSDPLEGKTLKHIVTQLVKQHGWKKLGEEITIKCFTNDPSINSTLKFLRKTPWARTKVEQFYLNNLTAEAKTKRNIWND